MFSTNKEANSEARDAELVDLAAKAIYVDNYKKAESLLEKVIDNTPQEYLYRYQENGSLVVKFWNQQEYNQYCSWQKKQGQNQAVIWIKSAYPRAYYFLGFLKIKTKQYEEAIEYLEKGRKLEPTNPKFNFEQAQALFGLQRYSEALKLYEDIKELGPHISKYDLAKALTGKGSTLLEIGELEAAEAAYSQSLQFEPHNYLVMSKLKYIQDLRNGKEDITPDLFSGTSNHLQSNDPYHQLLENYTQSSQRLETPISSKLANLRTRAYLIGSLSIMLIILVIFLGMIS